MAQYVHKRFSYDTQDRLLEELCEILQDLETVKEKQYFLKDLLNRGERIMIIRRFQIAKLLDDEMTYDEIMKLLGVGRGTIARVERMLNFGRGGFRRAIIKLKQKKMKLKSRKK